jgi:hypothetical protein
MKQDHRYSSTTYKPYLTKEVVGERLYVIDSTYHIDEAILSIGNNDADLISEVNKNPLAEVKT